MDNRIFNYINKIEAKARAFDFIEKLFNFKIIDNELIIEGLNLEGSKMVNIKDLLSYHLTPEEQIDYYKNLMDFKAILKEFYNYE